MSINNRKKTMWMIPAVVLCAAFSGGTPASADNIPEMDRGLGIVTLKEFNSGKGDVVFRTSDRPDQWARPWEDDEARSIVLEHVRAGAVITVYDDSDGDRDDDYAVINVLMSADRLVIDTFEQDVTGNEYVNVDYKPHNGLDGKVSRIEID